MLSLNSVGESGTAVTGLVEVGLDDSDCIAETLPGVSGQGLLSPFVRRLAKKLGHRRSLECCRLTYSFIQLGVESKAPHRPTVSRYFEIVIQKYS